MLMHLFEERRERRRPQVVRSPAKLTAEVLLNPYQFHRCLCPFRCPYFRNPSRWFLNFLHRPIVSLTPWYQSP
jgi:hypothetical protein